MIFGKIILKRDQMSWNWCQLLGKYDFWAKICSRAKRNRGGGGHHPPHLARLPDVALIRVNSIWNKCAPTWSFLLMSLIYWCGFLVNPPPPLLSMWFKNGPKLQWLWILSFQMWNNVCPFTVKKLYAANEKLNWWLKDKNHSRNLKFLLSALWKIQNSADQLRRDASK